MSNVVDYLFAVPNGHRGGDLGFSTFSFKSNCAKNSNFSVMDQSHSRCVCSVFVLSLFSPRAINSCLAIFRAVAWNPHSRRLYARAAAFASAAQAGFPSPAEDYVEGKLDLNTHLIRRPAATFLVRAVGESMGRGGISQMEGRGAAAGAGAAELGRVPAARQNVCLACASGTALAATQQEHVQRNGFSVCRFTVRIRSP